MKSFKPPNETLRFTVAPPLVIFVKAVAIYCRWYDIVLKAVWMLKNELLQEEGVIEYV